MPSLNSVEIIGHMGTEPEMRYTPTGTPVTNFTVATNWKYIKDGIPKEAVEWHRVQVWGRQAELANQLLDKGSMVYVEGRIKTSKYVDKDGVTRSVVDIVARRFIAMSKKVITGNGYEPDDGDTGEDIGLGEVMVEIASEEKDKKNAVKAD